MQTQRACQCELRRYRPRGHYTNVSCERSTIHILDIPVDGDVETEKFNECLVIAKAKKGSQVGGVILVEVDRRNLALAENVAVDTTSNVRQFGDPVKRNSI